MPLNRRRFLAAATGAAATSVAVPAHAAAPPRLARAMRGVNVPGWFDQPGGAAPSDEVLERLVELGLTTLRIPIDGALLGDPRLVGAIDDALDRLQRHDIVTILDMHPGQSLAALLSQDPAAGGQSVTAAWEILSRLAAGHSPGKVWLELLNEPPLDAADWLPLRDRLAETVRRNAPDHTIVFGASRYQGIWETLEQPPLDDANAIAAIHFYWPVVFTHQCQSWGDGPTTRIGDLPFPATLNDLRVAAVRRALENARDTEALDTLDAEFASPWADETILAEFARLEAWSAATGTSVILNEFGVFNACVDAASRGHWTRSVRRAAEAHGVGWTYWDLDQGFGLMADRADAQSFDDTIIGALLA
jgi:endoglucanase